jgi:hypothetical protein
LENLTNKALDFLKSAAPAKSDAFTAALGQGYQFFLLCILADRHPGFGCFFIAQKSFRLRLRSRVLGSREELLTAAASHARLPRTFFFVLFFVLQHSLSFLYLTWHSYLFLGIDAVYVPFNRYM